MEAARQNDMRGTPQAQPDFLTVVNLNQCVPPNRPLRGIKLRMDAVLQKLSPLFDELYAAEGCPSVPPEQRKRCTKLSITHISYHSRKEMWVIESSA